MARSERPVRRMQRDPRSSDERRSPARNRATENPGETLFDPRGQRITAAQPWAATMDARMWGVALSCGQFLLLLVPAAQQVETYGSPAGVKAAFEDAFAQGDDERIARLLPSSE